MEEENPIDVVIVDEDMIRILLTARVVAYVAGKQANEKHIHLVDKDGNFLHCYHL